MKTFRIAQYAVLTAATFLVGCAAPTPRADACGDLLSPVVTNSCVVVKGALWRGAKPDASAASELVNLGVRTVVNLELLHDDQSAFRDSRPTVNQLQTVRYFRVRDWEPNVVIAPALLDGHVAEFIAITRTQPQPIYVHCRSGQNRTGVMIAAYRILEQNVSVDAAIVEMERYQGFWFKDDAEYLRQLDGQRRERLKALVAKKVTELRPTATLDCTKEGCIAR